MVTSVELFLGQTKYYLTYQCRVRAVFPSMNRASKIAKMGKCASMLTLKMRSSIIRLSTGQLNVKRKTVAKISVHLITTPLTAETCQAYLRATTFKSKKASSQLLFPISHKVKTSSPNLTLETHITTLILIKNQF